MNEKIIKPGIVKRVVDNLYETRIVIGGNKEQYKRKYHLKYTQEIVNNVIDAFMDVVIEALENGDTIKLNGYMTIEPKYCAERMGNNFHTGERVVIPAQYKAKISVGTKLEEACKRLTEKEQGKVAE